MKNKFYKDFTKKEITIGYTSMKMELEEAPNWVKTLFYRVWKDFKENKFSYDGATFVAERYSNTQFEVAALIHDYFNHIGYVGKNVDTLFVDIMEVLGYKKFDIYLRKFLMNLTFINVIIHILDKNKKYEGDIDITDYKPSI